MSTAVQNHNSCSKTLFMNCQVSSTLILKPSMEKILRLKCSRLFDKEGLWIVYGGFEQVK